MIGLTEGEISLFIPPPSCSSSSKYTPKKNSFAMSETNSNLDLPALSTDESASSMTDNSTSMNESNRLSSQKNFTTAPVPPPQFMDQSFFYSLGQLSADNPLLFMQQQNTGFADQFLKENGESSNNQSRMNVGDSTSTLAQSIASNMESFQAAITTSVGEQPLSFWTGLNNVNSRVHALLLVA